MGRGADDDQCVRKHLKAFVGGLPNSTTESSVGQHFARYGQIVAVSVVPPKEGDGKKAPYAFVTFKFAADADAAVVDTQVFPGCARPLAMGFATPRRKDAQEREAKNGMLSDVEPGKVFVGGIGDRDSEDEVGDFFSQWGLVALVYRDRAGWGFVHYATKEGALRLLEEGSVVFQRRRLDVKAADSKRPIDDAERNDLIRRAIARHFHKKTLAAHPALPSGGPAAPGYPGYYGGAPPPGYLMPPPGYYPPPVVPGVPPAAGYPSAPGYPPPSGYPAGGGYPPPTGYYGPPPPGGYYGAQGAPPNSGPPHGGEPQPHAQVGEGMRALPAPSDFYRSGPGSGSNGGSGNPPPAANDPYGGGYYSRADPYGHPAAPPSAAPVPGTSADLARVPPVGDARGGSQGPYSGYYRDSREGDNAGGSDRRRPPAEDYYRSSSGSGPPPSDRDRPQTGDDRRDRGDPYYRTSSQPSQAPGHYQPPGAPGVYAADHYGRAPDHRYPSDARCQPY